MTLSEDSLRALWFDFIKGLEVSKSSMKVPKHIFSEFFELIARGDLSGPNDSLINDSQPNPISIKYAADLLILLDKHSCINGIYVDLNMLKVCLLGEDVDQ